VKTLVATVAVAAALLTPLPAEARQAPVLTASYTRDPSLPRLVLLNGDTTWFSFAVTTTEATTVTVTGGGPGLSALTGSPQAVAGSASLGVYVAATTPGTHTLSVTFSAPSAAPVVVDVPYVVATRSPLPPSTGSLAGRSYGWMGYENIMESSTRDARMLTFVNATYAYVGLPPAGAPKCTKEGNGCLPYSYDSTTGFVQVGGYIVGKVLGEGLYTDGWIPADEEDGELFSPYTAKNPLTFAAKGTRLSGVWHFKAKYYPAGIWAQSVTFRKNGTYELYYQVGARDERHSFSGTYAVTKTGRIVFKAKGRVVQIGTLALPGPAVGEPQPRKLGLWLVLSGPKGRSGDGNLLAPVKGR
jgi:hypothetical protein